jgi:signal transduction histidine kinase
MTNEDFDFYFLIFSAILVFSILSVFIIYFFKANVRTIQKTVIEKQHMQSQFQQELLRTQIEIQEQTLKTISQEIHDNVGQVLSLAKLNLNTFNTTTDEQSKKITDTKNLVSKAIIDLRNLSRSMYGDQLSEVGLKDAIANELAIVQSTGQYKTILDVNGEPFKMAPQKEMVLFRMVQEAINNIIRHAKAQDIFVRLKYNVDYFSLTIADNGKGFDTRLLDPIKNGMGLKSMQNRAALIGGTFNIDSTPGKGTTISLELLDATDKT